MTWFQIHRIENCTLHHISKFFMSGKSKKSGGDVKTGKLT